MKLGEALQERKNLGTRISELRERFSNAAVHEEGDKPEESAAEVLKSFDATLAEYQNLIVRVNRTNNAVRLSSGETMMEAIARRDCLKLITANYKSMAEGIRNRNSYRSYASKDAAKKVVAEGVDIAKLNKAADDAASELRKVDAEIQAAGWANELL
jgi:uncharacterized coiled-coil DUF342 family protein